MAFQAMPRNDDDRDAAVARHLSDLSKEILAVNDVRAATIGAAGNFEVEHDVVEGIALQQLDSLRL